MQGPPQHAGKAWRYLPHESGHQRCLANAAHAQHGHEPAAVQEQPMLQFRQLISSSIQSRHVQSFAPVTQ